jgi:hypothetical protein
MFVLTGGLLLYAFALHYASLWYHSKHHFMKTFFQLIGKQVCILLFVLVSLSGRAQEKIPAKWQPGMKLSMSYGGGMQYYSYTIEITSDSSFMLVNDQGLEKKYKLILTPEQLDDILQILIKKNFSRIESEYSGFAYDKGSEDIMLSWNGKFAGAGESSAMSIKEKCRNDFREIQHYLYELALKIRIT